MTMPAGAQYLPPVVTRLLGDASDLLAKFAEAKAAQEAYAKSATDMGEKVKASTRGAGRDVDEFTDLVVRKMHAGETATATLKRRLGELGEEVGTLRKRLGSEGANQGLYQEFRKASDELQRMTKLAREIAPDLLDGGRRGGKGFVSGFIESMSGIGSLIVPLLVGAVILASPAIAALIGSAVAVGIGLGFAGIGVLIAALLLPKVQAQFANMGRNFKRAFTFAVSGAFDDGLRVALNGFNRMIPLFGKQLRSIFDALAPALVPLSNALGEGIKAFLDGIIAALPQIMPALLTFISTIPAVMKAVADFLVAITANGPALSRFILDASNAIISFLNGAGAVIAWLEGAYLWIVKLNDAFPFIGWQRQAKGLAIGIAAVRDFFVDLWAKIVDAAKAVGSWFADLGRAIWGWLGDAGAAVADWFTTTVNWFKMLPGRVVGFLASMPGRVIAIVKNLAHQAAYWVGWLVGRWFRFITEAPGKIVAGVAQAWNWITAKFQEGVTNTLAFLEAFPGKVAEYFAYLWSAVTGWVSRTWASVVDWFGRTKTAMIDAVVNGIDAVIGWFRTLPSRASEQGKAFKDRVFEFFKDAKTWLVEAGKNVVRGLIDGVAGMWDWAVGKVKSFAHDIWKGFNDALGIHSPAKAFESSGAYSALGYVRGWTSTLRKAKAAFSAPSTADIIFSGDVAGGAPRRPGSGFGDDPRGPAMVHATFQVGTRTLVDAITPASQRRGARNGVTGTGVPTTRIM